MKSTSISMLFRIAIPVIVTCVQSTTTVPIAYAADSEAAAKKSGSGFKVDDASGKLVMTFDDQPFAEFVYRDDQILRPYFTRIHSRSGTMVTRNHPPVAGADAVDHDLMHPGIWLAFGDTSGGDFWRNKARIEHVRFTEPPMATKDRVTFATESRLVTSAGKSACQLTSRFSMSNRLQGSLLRWDATFLSNDEDFVFGDQEEMGFGARLATPLIEKNGGTILSSTGKTTAKATWGQSAAWCDYSKTMNGKSIGITLMSDPGNFRESWWHNRDYGLTVSNPFGRNAMKQGDKSSVVVKKGEPFHIGFAALVHDAAEYDPAKAYDDYRQSLK